jgi:hypothetical protein
MGVGRRDFMRATGAAFLLLASCAGPAAWAARAIPTSGLPESG